MLLPDAAGKPGGPSRDLSPGSSLGPAAPSVTELLRSPHGLSVGRLQGIKKPYNPILGETFRCGWFHPQTNSLTFYVAEQARAAGSTGLGCGGQGL